MALWLKLDVGILNHRKIRLVRKQPQGDSLALMWVGFLCLAMEQESEALYISEGIPYTAEDLATALDFKIKTVKNGIILFKNYGLIEIIDDGAIFINSLHERQAIDKLLLQRELGKERQRRSRERNALVTRDKAHVTRLSRVGNANVTRENSEEEVEGEYKNSDAPAREAPETHIPFSNPPEKPRHDISLFVAAWNGLGLPEFRQLPTNIPNMGQIMQELSVYSDEEIVGAMKNYEKILNDAEYDAFPTYPFLTSFLSKGVKAYFDGAKPFESKRKKGLPPPKPASKGVILSEG